MKQGRRGISPIPPIFLLYNIMNKLTDIVLDAENSELRFVLHTQDEFATGDIAKLYIDESYNYANMYSNNDELHSYVLKDTDSTTLFTFGSATDGGSEWLIPVTIASPIFSQLLNSMKHIWLTDEDSDNRPNIEAQGLYYDDTFIYECEMKKLNSYCSTCLDDQQMQRIMLITFKKQLLDLAIASKDLVNEMKIYSELMRLLDVSINRVNCCTTGRCSNGVCSLC